MTCLQIDLKKVNMDVIKKWMYEKVTEYLHIEDEVTSNVLINSLEQHVEAKSLQVMATEFFGKKKASVFVEELWTLLADAQSHPTGVPAAFIEQKKQEMLAQQQRQLELQQLQHRKQLELQQQQEQQQQQTASAPAAGGGVSVAPSCDVEHHRSKGGP